MSGPTPGPWRLRHEWHAGQAIGAEIESATGLVLGYVGSCEADARLVASAPDLLEAAKAMVEPAGEIAYRERWMALKSAIAKAEGR